MSLSRRARWSVAAAGALAGAAAAWLLYQRVQAAAEIDRLASTLALEPGTRVADVGAGKGRFALAVARIVGPDGRVFATEIDPERLLQIRQAVERERLANVTVIEAGSTETGLADGCCDAAYLRDVYHHLADPAAVDRGLHRALVPGGRLLVIDFEPGWFLTRFFPVEGAPARRGGHGVAPDQVIEELTAAGFELDRRIERWGFGTFAVVFRRPA
jgi:SAM-dependent methyltransferase